MAEVIDTTNHEYIGTGGANNFSVYNLSTEFWSADWTINGVGGSDTLGGGDGNDTFDAGPGNDMLNGGAGNDTFLVGVKDGFDSYDGGDTVYVGADGIDVIKAQQDNAVIGISGLIGIDEISADGYGRVTIRLANGIGSVDFSGTALTGLNTGYFDGTSFFVPGKFYAQIQGTSAADTIIGSLNSQNFIDGGQGNDTLVGGNLNDVFYFGVGYDALNINGGGGSNTLQAYESGATIVLTSANMPTNVTTISAERLSDGFAGGPTFYFDVKILGTNAADVMDFTSYTLKRIAKIDAGAGNDILTGSAGNETLLDGGSGDDIIYGGLGNDTIDGGGNHDVLYGGDGNDTFYVSSGADFYYGGKGDDSIYVTGNNQTLELDKDVLKSIETIDNSGGYTNFRIGAANTEGSIIDLRSIFVAPGYVSGIYGSGQADSIYGSTTYDYIYGGGGDDSIFGGGNYYYETSLGTGDEIYGGGGNDEIFGGASYDTLDGGSGDDVIYGGTHDDVLFGDTGDDHLYGDGGNDVLAGGKNDDNLYAKGGGFDAYYGEERTTLAADDKGIDVLHVLSGSLQIASEAVRNPATNTFEAFNAVNGIDVIQSDVAKQINIVLGDALAGNIVDFTNVTFADVDIGGVLKPLVKMIQGSAGKDTITGSALDDVIDGKAGIDVLNGGAGNDKISGDVGLDILTGGLGNDVFSDTVKNLNGDTITDFQVGDRINMENIKSADLVGLITYTDDGTGTGGTLSILGNGALKNGLEIKLVGSFESDDFTAVTNAVHGTDIVLI